MEKEFLDLEDEYQYEDGHAIENKNKAAEEAQLPPRYPKPPLWHKDYKF